MPLSSPTLRTPASRNGWRTTSRSAIVELADQLLASGVDTGALHLTPLRTLDDDGHPRAPRGNPNELRLADKSDTDRTLVIGIDQKLGWSVDQIMPLTGGSGRLDLASALGLKAELPHVGVNEVALEELAQLLMEDTGWVDNLGEGHRQLGRYGPTPREVAVYSKKSAEQAASAWLRWAGFTVLTHRRSPDAALTPAVELTVDFTEKQIGIGGVQRYKGIAAVNGRTPVVIARAGFSKNARTWAEAAEMLLFTIAEDGCLHPNTALAAAYTPTEVGRRPQDCDDTACRTFGCVLDDCASNWGTYSDPDAERMRL